MTKRGKRVQPVEQERASGPQKLMIGVAVMAMGTIGLSIAWAAGVWRPEAADETPRSVAAAEVAVPVSPAVVEQSSGVGMEALRQAAEENKYLFAFFWKSQDHQTTSMREVFESATAQVEDRARAVAVRVTDLAESEMVKKFQLSRAPMPLVLAIAPNGAVTGGFPTRFETSDLLNAFGSPVMEQCLEALQDGKLVLLCAQNDSTQSNAEALHGVEQFRSDPRFKAATRVVMVDPRDPAEASFLGDLQIDPNASVAVTTFLVPPGSAIAEFVGPTTKDELMAALQNAGSCGPGGGCGPSGCAPQ